MFKEEQEAHPKATELGYFSLFRIASIDDIPSVNLAVGDRCGGINLYQYDGECNVFFRMRFVLNESNNR
jgi:hypothetical protein